MNNDLISRKALKEAIEKYRPKSKVKSLFLDGEHCMFMNCISEIDNAPTVEAISNKEGYEMYNKGYMSGYERGKPERPQGEWKFIEDSDCWRGFLCNQCGKAVNNKENFCPNCGADMRGNT